MQIKKQQDHWEIETNGSKFQTDNNLHFLIFNFHCDIRY